MIQYIVALNVTFDDYLLNHHQKLFRDHFECKYLMVLTMYCATYKTIIACKILYQK